MDRDLIILVLLVAAVCLISGAILSMARPDRRFKLLGSGLLLLALIDLGLVVVAAMAM
ncbi:MAG: hypothetical protein ACLQRH_17195 [Acidimicrobiales bacterium]